MARLKVRLRGKQVSEVNLDEGREYIVGRKEDCDIVLQPEKGISREHFKIVCNNGVWGVEVTSRYGDIIMGGEKAQNFTLEHGQVFSVPPYEFEFLMSSSEVPVTEEEIPMESQMGESGPEEKTVVGVSASVPYVKVVDASGEPKEMFRLEGGDTWTAGREGHCHIQIRDQRVSRKQFEIRKINSQYYILDLGSVNGTLLNGNPISSSEPTPIRSGDGISVLDNLLTFELHDPNFKSRLEMVNLQPLTPLVPVAPVSPEAYGDALVAYQQSQVPAQYDPNMVPMPHQPASLPVAQGGLKNFDFKKNRIKIIIGAVLLLAAVYYFAADDAPKPKPVQMAQDPFSKLKPEQQLLVKQSYQLSKNLYMQGKYELAQNEINKILELVPDYEDTKEIQRLSREAIFIQDQKRHQEEVEKAKAEAEEKILKKVAECAKIINPQVTMPDMDNCLSDVLQFNPDHPKILELKSLVGKIISDREVKDAERLAHAEQVAKLKAMYGRAAGLQKKGKNLQAIRAYQVVIASHLPDPHGLHRDAEGNIAAIRKMMNSRTASLQAESEKFVQAGNLKGAIQSLRKARQVDPENDTLQEKIDRYVLDLKKQMMVLYQEGILEESFGNVEGSESKAGAKDKWKKIIDQDIPDGEYYKKAYIKLKKLRGFLMKIQERSYNSKLLRPKPVVHVDDDGSLIIIATAWGQPEHARKVTEEIAKYVGAAKADVEVTSPFEFLSCLPDEVNYLRTAILIANEDLYRGENRAEYFSGVEVVVLYKKGRQLAWAQVGAPALLLKRGGLALQPLSAPVDLATELALPGEILSPLPSQLLGLDPTCDIKVGHFYAQDTDQIVLLGGSRLPNSLWIPGIHDVTLPDLTQHIIQENPDPPFWLGLVNLSED